MQNYCKERSWSCPHGSWMYNYMCNQCTKQRCAPVTSTNKTDSHDITEKFLKVTLNSIHQTKPELPYAKGGSLVRYNICTYAHEQWTKV